MTNVAIEPLRIDATDIGLSISPYLTENWIHEEKDVRVYLKRFKHGEMLIRSFTKPRVDMTESRSVPPVNKGERIQEQGLSKRGKTRITRAARHYQYQYGRANMITLSYGDTSLSSHEQSKKDLDRFNKSLTRYVAKEYGLKAEYVWVAEIQEGRLLRTGVNAIHYHVLTPHYIPSKLISKWWNNSVNKPRMKKGLPTQELFPNVINANHAGRYISKYVQKNGHRIIGNGYNMSQATSAAIKAIQQECFDISMSQLERIKDLAFTTLVDKKTEHHFFQEWEEKEKEKEFMIWISNGNEYALGEMLKYELNGNESIKINT